MKIHINEDSHFEEIEITINCNKINSDVEKVISKLRILDLKLAKNHFENRKYKDLLSTYKSQHGGADLDE